MNNSCVHSHKRIKSFYIIMQKKTCKVVCEDISQMPNALFPAFRFRRRIELLAVRIGRSNIFENSRRTVCAVFFYRVCNAASGSSSLLLGGRIIMRPRQSRPTTADCRFCAMDTDDPDR